MDYIKDINIELNKSIENVSKHSKRDIQAIIDKITEKPHGLFYRTESNSVSKVKILSSLYNNVSLVDVTTTELSSTILDWVFDDNVSTTEDTIFGTETFATSEFENVTESYEITLFDKKNTTEKPTLIPKKSSKENKCDCNLLYKTCDVNCCCDCDCSDSERNLFLHNCDETVCRGLNNQNSILYSCYPPSECLNKITSFLENLFCISKSNLPDKRLTDLQFDEASIYRYPTWHSTDRQEVLYEFKKSVYKYKDPIWLYKNESIFYADIPMAVSNNYCNVRKPIKFLINEDIKCMVKLKDLHMFQALINVERGHILSPVETSINNTAENATFYHTNWTLLTCNEDECLAYNKTRDEPYCQDIYCNNIATIIEYSFYYFHSKITKAVLKLNVQKVSMQVPFITQHIKVKFYLSNESEEELIKLSGNPGYIWGLPVIISSVESNHTLHFFNDTDGVKKILKYPDNKSGSCVSSNISYKVVQFGHNRRSKCRYHIKQDVNLSNGTSACLFIQKQILLFLGLNSTLHVSPYGNPQDINDDNWIKMRMFDTTYVYGQFKNKNSELMCNNVITRIGYVVAYADKSSDISKAQNKILYVNIEGTAQNITFDIGDVSMVLTVDTRFIDTGESDVYEYAGAPHLNLHLPNSFFLPSNKGNYIREKTIHLRFKLFLLCPFIVRLY